MTPLTPERNAIHAIRNDLTPILWFAELALAGDREAQELVIKELVSRTTAINAELDILSSAVRRQINGNGSRLVPGTASGPGASLGVSRIVS